MWRARGGRIAHVVQRVEDADEVVSALGEVLGRCDFEADSVGDAGLGGALARDVDRGLVIVEADHVRAGIRLREQNRGGAVPASEVGDRTASAQLLVHPVERRYPRRNEVRNVSGLEQPLGPVKQVVMVLVPAQTLTAL